MRRLVESGRFLVFERPDLGRIEREQAFLNDANLVGVDALIMGSVTEFGRSVEGKRGFFSSTKKQVAHAKVEVRLVDPRTGHAFFSASGSGEATTEAGEIAGFGSKASYDGSLNDKVFSAAVSDLMNGLVSKLEARTWRTDILDIQQGQMFITGGARQGISVGDTFAVMREGKTIKSQQTGFEVTLPGTKVGAVKVVSLFGDSETNEGAVARVVSGTFDDGRPDGLYVAEE